MCENSQPVQEHAVRRPQGGTLRKPQGGTLLLKSKSEHKMMSWHQGEMSLLMSRSGLNKTEWLLREVGRSTKSKSWLLAERASELIQDQF